MKALLECMVRRKLSTEGRQQGVAFANSLEDIRGEPEKS